MILGQPSHNNYPFRFSNSQLLVRELLISFSYGVLTTSTIAPSFMEGQACLAYTFNIASIIISCFAATVGGLSSYSVLVSYHPIL